MGNFILNGDFSQGFDYWNNGVGGGLPFTLSLEQAKATSDPDSTTELYYAMCQEFSVNDEILSGKVSVWCRWSSRSGNESDGQVRFVVELLKPNMGAATLLDTTKTAESGEGYLLNNYDIASELDQYGNYSLWLLVEVQSAYEYTPPVPPKTLERHRYYESYGWYDNINVNIAVQKYKTVIDKVGSAESHYSGEGYTRTTKDIAQLSESQSLYTKKFAMENVGLLEDYYVAGVKIGLVKETLGVSEAYTKKPKLFEKESFGLIEMHEIVSGFARHEQEYFKIDENLAFLALPVIAEITQLSEDYAYHKFKPIYLTREDMGFSETYSAKRTRGNLETSYTVGTPTQWSSTVPVITGWIKTKTEIN